MENRRVVRVLITFLFLLVYAKPEEMADDKFDLEDFNFWLECEAGEFAEEMEQGVPMTPGRDLEEVPVEDLDVTEEAVEVTTAGEDEEALVAC